MEQFFAPSKIKTTGLSQTEILFQRELPHFLLEIVRNYFRLEVEGLEHVPKKGRVLLVPNHSGVTALDAVMVGHEIYRNIGRIARVLAHPLWFIGPHIRVLSKRMGLAEASKGAGEKLLRKGHAVLIFPEGEAGNFKPTAQRYKLREFRRGFVRMAMATKCPIVPIVVIGAEETNINLSNLKFHSMLKGILIPIPLNVLPLPAKWKIIFLPPIDMKDYSPEDADNSDLVHKIANEVRERIQARMDEEISKRDWIYFPKGSRKKNRTVKRTVALRESERKMAERYRRKTGKKKKKKVVKKFNSTAKGATKVSKKTVKSSKSSKKKIKSVTRKKA